MAGGWVGNREQGRAKGRFALTPNHPQGTWERGEGVPSEPRPGVRAPNYNLQPTYYNLIEDRFILQHAALGAERDEEDLVLAQVGVADGEDVLVQENVGRSLEDQRE